MDDRRIKRCVPRSLALISLARLEKRIPVAPVTMPFGSLGRRRDHRTRQLGIIRSKGDRPCPMHTMLPAEAGSSRRQLERFWNRECVALAKLCAAGSETA